MEALKIVNCTDTMRWYANMIGEIVPYLGDAGDEYKSREPAGYINFVRQEDAEIVEI